MKYRVAVIFGGRSVEHDVSIITGLQVVENLNKDNYDIIPIYISIEGDWYTGKELLNVENYKNKKELLKKCIPVIPSRGEGRAVLYRHPAYSKPFQKKMVDYFELAIPAVHGTYGEDGHLQAVLENLDVPYVGSDMTSSALGMDKVVMKEIFKSQGFPMVNYIWFYRSAWEKNPEAVIEEIKERLGFPLFVKPSNLGSSIGISRVDSIDDLNYAIDVACSYSHKIIVEEAVKNPREINCAVMGYENNLTTSLCEEPLNWKEFLTYEDKYLSKGKTEEGSSSRKIPADITEDQKHKVEELAKMAFLSIGASGVARIDFLMDEKGNIVVNEINTIPGSFSFYLWEPMGITFADLLDKLIEIGIRNYNDRKKNQVIFNSPIIEMKSGGKK